MTAPDRSYDPKRRPNIFYKGDSASTEELERRTRGTRGLYGPLVEANKDAFDSTSSAAFGRTVGDAEKRQSKGIDTPVSGDDMNRIKGGQHARHWITDKKAK